MTEFVPARRAEMTEIPVRYDVVVPQQNPVKRPRCCNKIIAVVREDDAIDQSIDCRIRYPDQIGRTRDVRGPRAPVILLLVAGSQRCLPHRDDDIEIPVAQPIGVLYIINQAHHGVDANALQRRPIEQNDSFETLITDQKLDAELLVRSRRDKHEVLNLETGLEKEAHGLKQIRANCLLVGIDRIPVWRGENLRRNQ